MWARAKWTVHACDEPDEILADIVMTMQRDTG